MNKSRLIDIGAVLFITGALNALSIVAYILIGYKILIVSLFLEGLGVISILTSNLTGIRGEKHDSQ